MDSSNEIETEEQFPYILNMKPMHRHLRPSYIPDRGRWDDHDAMAIVVTRNSSDKIKCISCGDKVNEHLTQFGDDDSTGTAVVYYGNVKRTPRFAVCYRCMAEKMAGTRLEWIATTKNKVLLFRLPEDSNCFDSGLVSWTNPSIQELRKDYEAILREPDEEKETESTRNSVESSPNWRRCQKADVRGPGEALGGNQRPVQRQRG